MQRAYYARTANAYDRAHAHEGDAHYFALSFLLGALDFLEATSVLEVGAGTGRALLHLTRYRPELTVRGIEPVDELREAAYAKGLSRGILLAGDGNTLAFADQEFDAVCAFGVLHHVPRPDQVIREMLRVARRAIFISDSNNFGQGSPITRTVKQAINAVHLWRLANWIRTRGRGYQITEGDGLAYSYSVFNDYELIRRHCRSVHILNTAEAGVNPYRSASHVAMLGIKGG